ncbi:MAG: hypothetical protein JSR39_08015 [Verrucomicrobia bacterium]|nr:hypothetical protein [Verrucomicrobiota bacterium]
MAISIRLLTGCSRSIYTSFHAYGIRAYSTSGNNSIFSFFKKFFPSETAGKPPLDNTPRIIMLPEKELQALCDRNFERQLKEIADKARKTAANTSKGPVKDE